MNQNVNLYSASLTKFSEMVVRCQLQQTWAVL